MKKNNNEIIDLTNIDYEDYINNYHEDIMYALKLKKFKTYLYKLFMSGMTITSEIIILYILLIHAEHFNSSVQVRFGILLLAIGIVSGVNINEDVKKEINDLKEIENLLTNNEFEEFQKKFTLKEIKNIFGN